MLDLGCNRGSFSVVSYAHLFVVALDVELPTPGNGSPGVQADAARLPFGDATFDAIISNHSLEHMDRLPDVLGEAARVIRPDGSLYVAVPDASTLSDRLYRWIYHGGGHVNPFRSASELTDEITRVTRLPLAGARKLHSSFSFLERGLFHPRPPRRLWLVGNGNLKFIAAMGYAMRVLDRLFGTRLSVYGWAFYFGTIRETIEERPWTNVCAKCGNGYAAEYLEEENLVRRGILRIRYYRCPACGGWNLFTSDVT